jgi:CheY-like chemotaxis protein
MAMKTILVFGDDPVVGDMLTQALELAGYRSVLAGAGERIDAYCADMVLCDMHGLAPESVSLRDSLRGKSGLCSTPCVVVSSYYGYVAAEECDTMTLKPFELKTVLETVQASIGWP